MFRNVCCVLLLSYVLCETYYNRDVDRFVDIYTNYKDADEVVRNYEDIYGINRRYSDRDARFVAPEKISHESLDAAAYTDRIDFHYPHIDFVTKNEHLESDYGKFQSPANADKFVFLQSQSLSSNGNEDSSERPFGTWSNHEIQLNDRYRPIKLSYVQKIPKPTKYEDNDVAATTSNSDNTDNTKNRINLLLKKYLTRLYTQKYNSTRTPGNVTPTLTSKLNPENPKTNLIGSTLWSFKNKTINKINKFLSIFTLIQFNNTQCNATNSSGSYLGICYTAAECQRLRGSAVGNCASGYGVCCVFRGTCGGSASQNCSYFESPNYPDYYPSTGSVIVPTTAAPPTTANPSPTPDPRLTWYGRGNREARQNDNTLSCIFSVYKANSRVTRMRIDFVDLELASPTNGTCTTERLVITGQNVNSRIPVICGYNTGQHVYLDVSMVVGPIRISVLSTMTFRKRFKIRICQYSESCSEPTSNCLQYYTGVTGTISSFNYDQAASFNRSVSGYFNNLNYAICIRREAGYCSITYTNVRNGVEYPFQLINMIGNMSTVPRGQAGAGVMDCPDDYILIDGVRLCGDKFNDGTVVNNASLNAPVTDTNAGPIVIPVRTNAALTALGFKLFYTENPCPAT